MYPSFDEKGKIFTNVISKVPVDVIIQTTQNQIRGKLHIRPDDRLKDEINHDETFLAITDAEVINPQGEVLYRANFVAVNRAQVIWLLPVDEIIENPSDV
jgi:hypothetical protein